MKEQPWSFNKQLLIEHVPSVDVHPFAKSSTCTEAEAALSKASVVIAGKVLASVKPQFVDGVAGAGPHSQPAYLTQAIDSE